MTNKHSRKSNNRKILSRSKISSGTKRSENDIGSELEKVSAGSNPIDLSKAKKIMRNNLSKGDPKRNKVNYKDIIKKQTVKQVSSNKNPTSLKNSGEIMKKNIELGKISNSSGNHSPQNISKLGSSRTPHINNSKASIINDTLSRKLPQISNSSVKAGKKTGVGIPVYRRRKIDYEQSTNDASSYYSKNVSLNMYKKSKYQKPSYQKPPLKMLHRRRMDNSPSLPVIVNSISMSPKSSIASKSPKGLASYEVKNSIIKPTQGSYHLRKHNKGLKNGSSNHSRLVQQSMIYKQSPVRNIKGHYRYKQRKGNENGMYSNINIPSLSVKRQDMSGDRNQKASQLYKLLNH